MRMEGSDQSGGIVSRQQGARLDNEVLQGIYHGYNEWKNI